MAERAVAEEAPRTGGAGPGFATAFASTKYFKVNLGAGSRPIDDETWRNADLHPGPGIQDVFDAGKDRWPYPDASCREIFSMHCLEHIVDMTHVMREAQRVLMPGGHFMIRVPYGNSTAAMGDPTHVRPLYPWTFMAYTPGYDKMSHNLQHEVGPRRWPNGFMLDDIRLILSNEHAWMRRWPWRKVLPVSWMSTHWFNICGELWVRLHRLNDREVELMEQGLIQVSLEARILNEREALDGSYPLDCAVERSERERKTDKGGR